jgi:hypothetical protein
MELPALNRRRLLARGGATLGGMLLPLPVASAGPVDVGMGLRIRPRDAWGRGLKPTGKLRREEVRFLLVHHTAGANDYERDEVRGILRGMFAFHTETKGWPDVAYNFLVDRFGRVWEGRAGSLDRPVRGNATGGNQGFDQKCCFIGNHQEKAPSPAAVRAMVRLLAWLCVRYDIDSRRAARVRFVSRGSNRWPKGTRVRTRTIQGHRAMSYTVCPGDAAFDLLDRAIPRRVTSRIEKETAAGRPGA